MPLPYPEDLLAWNTLATVELSQALLDLLVQEAALVKETQSFLNDLLGGVIATCGQLFTNELLGVA
jgi:hypothetical protein